MDDEHPGPPGRGPKFDTVMRSLARFAPSAVCNAFTGGHDRVEALSESFPAATRVPDQLFRAGPSRLIHFEFERRAGPGLVARMVVYRGLIMEKYPADRLEQHVVVLGSGRVGAFDDLPGRGFALDLTVTYLRDQPPQRFLTDPVLAPLATIDQAVKETDMSIESIASFYEGTELGQVLLRRGQEQGREQGREQGATSARAAMLSAVLRQRFGDRAEIELLARRMATLTETESVQLVTAATSLEALLADRPGPAAPPG